MPGQVNKDGKVVPGSVEVVVYADESGEVYNIGTHERVKFGEMVDAVLEAAGSGSKTYVPWPEDYEKNETGDYIANTTRIEGTTGWKPQVLLKDGISRMVEYYKENKDHYWE